MELEYWDKNPFKAIAKAFQPGFHFKPTTINITRTFYEFILIDSDSVSIKHFKDPKEPLLNTHFTIKILKVLQPRQFGYNLNEIKKFLYLFIQEDTPIGTIWMPRPKCIDIKTTNISTHGLFTSRLTLQGGAICVFELH